MRASLRFMRSMETTQETVAQRFGALVRRLAPPAGYDLTPGAGGRSQLAKKVGMSPSAIGRMLDGKTLPMPNQYEALAKALDVDVRELLVESTVLSESAWPKEGAADVRSATSQTQPLSPEAAADAWGIKDPMIRRMLISNIEQAIRLQREAESDAASTGAVGN